MKHHIRSNKDDWFRRLLQLGMSPERAKQAAAVEVGKSDGDVLPVMLRADLSDGKDADNRSHTK